MPPLLLAQTTPPAEALKLWLEVAVFLVAFVGAVIAIAYYVKGLRAPDSQSTVVSPQPFEVKPTVRMATYDELRSLEARLARLEERIDEQFSDFTGKAEDRARRMHERLDLLLEGMSVMKGELKRMSPPQG